MSHASAASVHTCLHEAVRIEASNPCIDTYSFVPRSVLLQLPQLIILCLLPLHFDLNLALDSPYGQGRPGRVARKRAAQKAAAGGGGDDDDE